jgi:hypothetical protein
MRSMSADPADWLAAVATATLPRGEVPYDPADPVPAPAPATLARRVVALMVDGNLVLFPGGILAVVITYLGWAPLSGTGDFDGPAQFEALGGWVLLATWCGLALAYFALEAFGLPTPGDMVAGLRFVTPGRHPWRRLMLRWLLSYSPLIVLMFFSLAGTAHTVALGWEAFEDGGHTAGELFWPVVAPLAVLWAFGFGWAGRARKQTLAEQAAGVGLLYAPRPPVRPPAGFEVVPAARPVLRA